MSQQKICVIGLGYVGLPLAIAFSNKFKVIGYDISENRIEELKNGIDSTLEVENKLILKSINNYSKSGSDFGFYPTANKNDISESNIYIVTVPTPTDKNKMPVLDPLKSASELAGEFIKEGNIVIILSFIKDVPIIKFRYFFINFFITFIF